MAISAAIGIQPAAARSATSLRVARIPIEAPLPLRRDSDYTLMWIVFELEPLLADVLMHRFRMGGHTGVGQTSYSSSRCAAAPLIRLSQINTLSPIRLIVTAPCPPRIAKRQKG